MILPFARGATSIATNVHAVSLRSSPVLRRDAEFPPRIRSPPSFPGSTPIQSHQSSTIRDILLGCWRQFVAIGLFSLCVNVLMLTSSLYMMQVYDRVLASGSTETLVLLSLIAWERSA